MNPVFLFQPPLIFKNDHGFWKLESKVSVISLATDLGITIHRRKLSPFNDDISCFVLILKAQAAEQRLWLWHRFRWWSSLIANRETIDYYCNPYILQTRLYPLNVHITSSTQSIGYAWWWWAQEFYKSIDIAHTRIQMPYLLPKINFSAVSPKKTLLGHANNVLSGTKSHPQPRPYCWSATASKRLLNVPCYAVPETLLPSFQPDLWYLFLDTRISFQRLRIKYG